MEKKLTIGVLIGNANSAHSIDTLHGIRQAAKETGVNIITFLGVHTSYFYRDFFEDEESYDYQVTTVFDFVKLARVDALIISYGELVIFLDEKERRTFLDKYDEIPYVILEEYVNKPHAHYQIADNYKGMRSVLEHLTIDHGYRRFVYLSGPEGNKDADERYRAFSDVMKEQGITVTEDMIREGDFSEAVDKEIEELFDLNPDMQAFVCANDLMASTVYKICKNRREELSRMTPWAMEWVKKSQLRYKIGMDVERGEGIALTGYDDWLMAATLDPPLTTVLQNAYSNGYKAVFNVLDIYYEKGGRDIILPPLLVRRNSCGCQNAQKYNFEHMTEAERQNPEFYALKLADTIKKAILISDVNDVIGDRIGDMLYDILYADTIIYLGYVNEQMSAKRIVGQLRTLMTSAISSYISSTALSSIFSDYLSFVIHSVNNQKMEVQFSEMLIEGMKYLQSYIYKNAKDELSEHENSAWFMSLIARDMVNHVDSEKEMFKNAMQKMKTLNIGNCYLYMFEHPILHTRDKNWVCPEKMYLSAYMTTAGEVVAYNTEDRPIVDAQNGFGAFIQNGDAKSGYHLTLINIFSDKMQYGVLVSEIAPEDALSLHFISIQMGTALKYCEMSKAQRRAQERLESLIKEVEDKNSMLRFISEYDALTGCLNRRGFIEKAVNLKNENIGEEAVVVFGDLDHLKEINDTYGHGEGDFAIKKMAEFMMGAVGQEELVGRLGGDEFVIMVLCRHTDIEERIAQSIQAQSMQYNQNSEKPYYIECSIGFRKFVCSDEIQLQDIMNQADAALYKAKLARRKSIIK